MREALKNIKIFLSDVDGVMTDTRVFFGSDGSWKRFFSIYDGVGLKSLQAKGIKVGIITASDADDVRARFKYLGVDFFYDKVKDKMKPLLEVLEKENLQASEAAYIGDDLADLPVIEHVGFGASVPHALDRIKKKSNYVTQTQGGRGAVREVCEMILEAQEG